MIFSVGVMDPYIAGSAMFATYRSTTLAENVSKIHTNRIAIAEFCGVIQALRWLYASTQSLPSQHAHIMCDNQYVIQAILKQVTTHPNHTVFTQHIYELIQLLKNHVACHFHWIPSHTHNENHNHADSLAFNIITSPLPVQQPHSFTYLNTLPHTGVSSPGLSSYCSP